jgi:pyruvate ferredoxin oxidoreductase alpha subunit
MAVKPAPSETKRSLPAQRIDFRKGNEVAAIAAKQVNYHVMGYYPITPSTEIAEELDEMYARGEHEIKMIPADGEHPAAGICYGASVAGGRVLNATSAQGLMFALEQLPVQSGTRFPMVLNLVTRAINGPLNILGDHQDLYFTLNTGWIILLARDPQAVYDMNIMAVRIGEQAGVRLPVIVAFDGFFTSHQKRRVSIFEDDKTVQDFIGPYWTPLHAVDPAKPVTIGPYMSDPDLLNNKYQLHLAMEAAAKVVPQVFKEYAALSGRDYSVVETYRMDDADTALFLLNTAAETAKDAIDRFREKGQKVGLVSPNVIRPFPAEEIRRVFKKVKAVIVGDRADSWGAHGGNMALEVKAALKDDPSNQTVVLSRVYGLGGKDFYVEDAEEFLSLAQRASETGRAEVPFDYYGQNPGDPSISLEMVRPPISLEESSPGISSVQVDETSGEVKVKTGTPRQLTAMPYRVAPGHGMCPGCGISVTLNQFLKGIEGYVVFLFHTGCGMVTTTGYPYSSHRVTYIHNLFQNGASTLSGVVEMYLERKRRGEIPAEQEITFIMITGDGGMDIGMGPAIGAALRGHPMIILEYDNEGYMNTGNQLSYATPLGAATSTSHVGPHEAGKRFFHKDTPQIMAATNIPYVFTGIEGLGTDLVRKGAKAQWHVRHGGFVYGKVLSVCSLSWRYEEKMGTKIIEGAANANFFPIYEVENGKTTINYDPEARGKKIPLAEWFAMMGRTRHLADAKYAEVLGRIEVEVDRRWQRLKARNESPIL